MSALFSRSIAKVGQFGQSMYAFSALIREELSENYLVDQLVTGPFTAFQMARSRVRSRYM